MLDSNYAQLLPWESRASSAPALPGGAALQKARLLELLRHIAGSATASWLADEDVISKSISQIGSLDFVQRSGDVLELTKSGAAWLESENDLALLSVLHNRLRFVGELLDRLKGDGARVEELLAIARDEYQLGWTSPDQIRRRLAWLQVLGLSEDGPDRLHLLTDKGASALNDLVKVSPEEISASIAAIGDVKLPTAPPHLQRELESADDTKRRMAVGYIPKDSLGALCAVVEISANGVEIDSLTESLAAQFKLSPASAGMFVQSARHLGLHKYTGRKTTASTALGVEWLTHATELNLVRLMHTRYLAFGEVLEVLGADLVSVGEVHRRLFPGGSASPSQTRTAGVLRRLADAGAVAEIGYARFTVTAIGRALLPELSLMQAEKSGDGVDIAQTKDERTNEISELGTELLTAATDVANSKNFELLTAQAFASLGVDAVHIGGPGGTDVLLTITSDLQVIGRVIVDAKSAASGHLREDSVVIETLKEHAEKHGADYMAVVAPGYDSAGRLLSRARSNGIVLLTAAELVEIINHHQRLPYSPRDVLELLTVDGSLRVDDRRSAELTDLALIRRILVELRSEGEEEGAEAITSRDIYRLLRKDFAVPESQIADVLEFLSHTRIGVVTAAKSGGFTLPSNLITASLRIRALADAVASADLSWE